MIRQECYRPWFVVTGVLLIALALNVAWTANTEPRIHDALREQGIATSMAEIKAGYPEPPEEENAAPLYLEAVDKLQALPSRDKSEVVRDMLPAYGGDSWLFAREALDFEQYVANMRLFLEERQEILDLLYQAAAREECRWHDEVFSAFREMNSIDIYSHMRELSRILYVDRCLAVLEGDGNRFLANFEANNALGNALVDYPSYIGHIVRDAILDMNLSSLDLMFALPELTFSNAQFQKMLEGIDHLVQINATLPLKSLLFEFAIYHELFYNQGAYYDAANSRFALAGPVYLRLEKQASRISQHILYNLFGFKFVDRIAAADILYESYSMYEETGAIADVVDRDVNMRRLMAEVSLQFMMMNRGINGRAARLSVSKVAIAVQRYFQEHGVYPENLEALTPQYLDAVPVDPLRTEQPIGYFVSDKGAILYALLSENQQERETSYRNSGDMAALEEMLTEERLPGASMLFGAYLIESYQDESAENPFSQTPKTPAPSE